jgi:hypothetical protein
LVTAFLGPAARNDLLPNPASSAVEKRQQSSWLTSSTEKLPTIREHPFQDRISLWLQPRWFALLLIAFNVWLVMVCFW